jgi:plastocyanin
MTLLAATPALAAAPPAATVSIENFTFEPATITVPAGSSVAWVNHDDIPHLVASTDKLFKSPALDTDDSFTTRFDQPGTYAYFCALHPHMIGTVAVTPSAH